MRTNEKKRVSSGHGRLTRILALILSLLVSGSALTYIIWMIVEMFS